MVGCPTQDPSSLKALCFWNRHWLHWDSTGNQGAQANSFQTSEQKQNPNGVSYAIFSCYWTPSQLACMLQWLKASWALPANSWLNQLIPQSSYQKPFILLACPQVALKPWPTLPSPPPQCFRLWNTWCIQMFHEFWILKKLNSVFQLAHAVIVVSDPTDREVLDSGSLICLSLLIPMLITGSLDICWAPTVCQKLRSTVS